MACAKLTRAKRPIYWKGAQLDAPEDRRLPGSSAILVSKFTLLENDSV
jgi:hypothetical protein